MDVLLKGGYEYYETLYSQLYTIVDFSLVNLSFDTWIDINLIEVKRNRNSVFSVIDYYEIIKIYHSLFSNVTILLYEELIKNIYNVISAKICPLMSIDAEKALQYLNNKKFNSRHHKSEMILLRITKFIVELLQKKLGYPQRIIPLETREKFMKSVRNKIRKTRFGKVGTEFKHTQKDIIANLLKDGNNALIRGFGLNANYYYNPL